MRASRPQAYTAYSPKCRGIAQQRQGKLPHSEIYWSGCIRQPCYKGLRLRKITCYSLPELLNIRLDILGLALRSVQRRLYGIHISLAHIGFGKIALDRYGIPFIYTLCREIVKRGDGDAADRVIKRRNTAQVKSEIFSIGTLPSIRLIEVVTFSHEEVPPSP